MKARFKNEVVKRFPSHGIELVGVFESATETLSLTYLTRFKSGGRSQQSVGRLGADPEWRVVKAASEVNDRC